MTYAAPQQQVTYAAPQQQNTYAGAPQQVTYAAYYNFAMIAGLGDGRVEPDAVDTGTLKYEASTCCPRRGRCCA